MTESTETTAFRSALEVIGAVEPDVATAISDELGAQRRQLKLIASENYASPAVLLAMGTPRSQPFRAANRNRIGVQDSAGPQLAARRPDKPASQRHSPTFTNTDSAAS